MEKSMLEIAFEYVSGKKSEVPFSELWDYVCKELGFTKEVADSKVSRFYANLMFDGRFVTLGDNKWTLRIREKFEKVHIDMNDVYSEVDSESDTDDKDDSSAEDAALEKAAEGQPVISSLEAEEKEEDEEEKSEEID